VISADGPYCHLQLDLTEMPTTTSGNRYIAVLECIFSKYVWTRALSTKHARGIVNFLQEVVNEMGPFQILQTDNGSEFKNQEVEEFASDHNIGI
jgi:transposase InsO family protein